jgi:hypothetical protein
VTNTEEIRQLLADLAEKLNDLEAHGVQVSLKYDGVITGYGYVLRGLDRWEAKLKVGEPPRSLASVADDD